MPLSCPKCQVEMTSMSLLQTEIDVCPLCNGCWLDCDELTRITRSRGADALKVRVVNKRPTHFVCPRCHGALHEGVHELDSEFYIDECVGCRGIWLDRGELPTLLSGLRKA